MKEYYGKHNVLNTLTFKTLTARSAVITACRGLGINDDVAHTIANYIPMERGQSWTLSDCLNGNEEAGRKPVQPFVETLGQYEDKRLRDTIEELEGLICGRSIHASAVYMYEDGFLKQNAMMRAPNGTRITAFNMTDSDVMGGLKLDLLTVKILDKIHTAINLLTESGVIEDQGSIKATYDKYLHPDVLELKDPAMWEMIASNEVLSLFQFDSLVGQQAASKIRPSSVREMTAANALMRLMAAEGQESPIDTFVKHKANIQLWYDEMHKAGLSDADIKIMEEHLLPVYGVASMQEEIMILSMDERISGFTMTEANTLRKGIAKKKKKVIQEVKELFFKKGRERGTSEALLNYVWNVQIYRQAGYSFSSNHCTPYSFIGLQNLNLAYRYSPIFWNTACLTIEAGADTENESTKTTDYSKIGAAIGAIKKQGLQVMPPYINEAKFDFYPDAERNEIVFSLKALRGLGDAQAACIVENQPYTSFQDFLDKTEEVVKPASVIALIKSGAFDRLEPRTRRELMRSYASTQVNTLTSLTRAHLKTLEDLKVFDGEKYKEELLINKYLTYVRSTEPAVEGKTPGKTWYYVRGRNMTEDFFTDKIMDSLKLDRDYARHVDGYYIMTGSSAQRLQNKVMEKIKDEVLNDPKSLEAVNAARIREYLHEKCPGSLSHWEMETMSFYFHPHELAAVDPIMYRVSNFNDLSETPVKISVPRGNRVYDVIQLTNIMGTVIGRNKDKHIVTLLTLDGVVNIKLYRDNFVYFNQQISQQLPDGKKKVIEESWFSHGNKLYVRGYRRDDTFVVKSDPGKTANSAVALITKVDNKSRTMQLKRERTFAG